MFRLKHKHTPGAAVRLPSADGRRLLAQQSVFRGLAGSIAMASVLCWLWALFSLTTGRIFPWITIVIGALIGIAMQRFGRGLDWRFPALAVIVAGLASYAGNLMIGILETGRYIEAGTIQVVRGLSGDTMRSFFHNTISPIDHIYAFCAGGIAAFFANRRLKRHEVLGLRSIKRVKS